VEQCVADVDAELVEALRRGDTDSSSRLVERYGSRVYGLAMRITGATQDAEDALREGLQMAIGAIHTFTGLSAFDSWIVRHVATRAYEKRRRRGSNTSEVTPAEVMPLLDSDGRFKPMEDWSNRIDDAVDGVLTKAIDTLPAEHRTALVLHDVEHVSKPEVAAILGIDVPGVRRRVHFARLFVRKRLSEHFQSAAAA
jgi:RNA polymerase sigma-70 factor (ECF subfamily)